MAAIDISDPAIAAGIADVFDKNTDTNWVILTYAPRSNTKLRVIGSGTDGWDEMCDEVNDGKICYGLCRFTINEVYRFVYLSWIGEGVQGMQAGCYNSHSGKVARIFEGFHVQINGRNDNDLEEDVPIARLSKAIGANYDAGETIQGVQGKSSTGPKKVVRTDPGIIDQNASSSYWEKQNQEAGAPTSGYKKDMSFQQASGASSLKNRFETLADQQKPDAPPARGTPKQIKLDTSSSPAVVESTPAPSQVSYPEEGAQYDAGGSDEGYAEEGYAEEGYAEEAYAEEGYAEEGYAEEGYAEEGYAEEAYAEEAYAEEPVQEAPAEEGYAEEGYAEEGYAEEGYAEEGYAEEAYAEEGYEEEAYAEEGYEEEAYGEGLYATALYDYAGENEDDLPFNAGDCITVLDQSDPSGWWKGELNGIEGYFPSNFVEISQ